MEANGQPVKRCTVLSPDGGRCDLAAGHSGRHEHDNGPVSGDPRENRHDVRAWPQQVEEPGLKP